jgi:superoxide dismutase, Fe-Mn family
MNDHYPFKLILLPYEYQAPEPYIDTEAVEIHHDKHLKTYVDNWFHVINWKNADLYKEIAL